MCATSKAIRNQMTCLLGHTLVEERVQLLVIINLNLPLRPGFHAARGMMIMMEHELCRIVQLASSAGVRTSIFCIPVVGFAMLIFMTWSSEKYKCRNSFKGVRNNGFVMRYAAMLRNELQRFAAAENKNATCQFNALSQKFRGVGIL